MNQFPGTNYHDLNLNWLLGQMKNCLAEWETTKGQWTALAADNAEFKEYVTNYLHNLDLTQEISDKIDALVEDGTLLRILTEDEGEGSPLSDTVGEWLAAHITQETGYVIDDTLTVQGAAADAKAAGDAIADLKGAMDSLGGVYISPTATETKSGYYTGESGQTIEYTSAANSSASTYDLSAYAGKTVTVRGTTQNSSSSNRIFAICNSSGVIAARRAEPYYTQDGVTFDITQTNYMLYVSYNIYNTTNVSVKVLDEPGRVGELESEVSGIEYSIDGVISIKTPFNLTSPQNGYYSGSVGDTIAFSSATNSKAYHLDLSEFVGRYAVITATTTASNSGRITALCDSSGKIAKRNIEDDYKKGKISFLITETDNQLYISYNIYNTTVVSVVAIEYGQIDLLEQKVDKVATDLPLYVSPNGNDSAEGTIKEPFQTISHALTVGNNIVLLPGTYPGETIDVDSLGYGEVSIKGQETGNVIIDFGTNILVNDGSETKVSGYNKVYSVPCETNPFASGNTTARMYQDYVPDTSTEITASDRHPLQRGKQYRCDSTIIKQCASISAIDALADGKYGFYWDDGTMYFSRPQASSAGNPIIIPTRDTSFINQYAFRTNRNQCKIILNNLEIRYADIRLSYSANHVLSDVAVKYPYVSVGGCFYLYCVTNTTLIRCEACSVTQGGATGDGFNVDTDDSASTANAVSLSLRLVDCWSHDNNDDGYSDHDHSEVTVEGGLYEYNGKGGITPAYGSNDIIINAVSRYNAGAGILSTGNPSQTNGRLKTCVYAEGCVCYGQVNGFYAPESETIIQAVNCVSYGNNVGYNGTSGHIYAVNCKSNDTTAKSGNVTVQTVNDLS